MSSAASDAPIEMWAGVECTVSRIGETWRDQLELTGHARRLDDIDRLAELGVRTVRYPVLWERTITSPGDAPDWRWSDHRLERLRARGLRPVVGLLHHGSGPSWTSLLDPEFPQRLAAFARSVAERYPWVDAYTPVNEPLTTARFSTLYGHWYPHARSDAEFARAILGQCRGTVLAMRAIREVQPRALLVQTEDLGKTHATKRLRYQAEFENTRRWITFDLLAGRVRRSHPMWKYLRWAGITERELGRASEECCAPDLLGMNHYITSERFLDEHLERYPARLHGGNGRDRYVDVEAVRVAECDLSGPRELLHEAWTRYRIPIVVSEAHLGCTREQQLRWLDEVWRSALECRADGADIRAVTVWSVFGAYDWASLMTRTRGQYEPGPFDVRAEPPRRTALARMVSDLAARGTYYHPVLAGSGWWANGGRRAKARGRDEQAASRSSRIPRPTPRCLVITGAGGMLGQAFVRLCGERGLDFRAFSRSELDIADAEAVHRVADALAPWAVVNAAGFVRVDDAERETAACQRSNVDGPATLARVCAQRGMALLSFSSDLVFDGNKEAPYRESDATAPLGVYGRSKVAAEQEVSVICPQGLIVRTGACFGPWDARDFVTCALQTLTRGLPVRAASDVTVSPTYIPDLGHACLDLLIDGESGIWHLANAGAITWAELARAAAIRAGLDAALVRACPIADLGLAARRPRYSVLSSERSSLMPSLDDALDRYFAARKKRGAPSAPGPSSADHPDPTRSTRS